MDEIYKQFKKNLDTLNEIIEWHQNKIIDLRWMPQHLRDKIPNIEELKNK